MIRWCIYVWQNEDTKRCRYTAVLVVGGEDVAVLVVGGGDVAVPTGIY